MTKCLHEPCQNEAEELSAYCKDCIQLPTYECNRCNARSGSKPNKKSMDVHTRSVDETIRIITDAKKREEGTDAIGWAMKFLMYLVTFILMLTLVRMVIK